MRIEIMNDKLTSPREELYTGLTAVFTVAASAWAWWKNNSFTQNAIAADEYKAQLDEGGNDNG